MNEIIFHLTKEDCTELKDWLSKYDNFNITMDVRRSVNSSDDEARLIFTNKNEHGQYEPGKLDPFYFKLMLAKPVR